MASDARCCAISAKFTSAIDALLPPPPPAFTRHRYATTTPPPAHFAAMMPSHIIRRYDATPADARWRHILVAFAGAAADAISANARDAAAHDIAARLPCFTSFAGAVRRLLRHHAMALRQFSAAERCLLSALFLRPSASAMPFISTIPYARGVRGGHAFHLTARLTR